MEGDAFARLASAFNPALRTEPMPSTAPAADAAHREPLIFTVSAPIGAGADAHRIARVGAWTFTVPGEAGTEPEIPDTALAEKLGMTLHHLRELSARHEKAENIAPRVYRTVRFNRGRPGKQRFYNEADALFLVTRSETPKAIALTKEMIAVYMLARRGLLVPAASPSAMSPEVLAALSVIPALARSVDAVINVVKGHGEAIDRLVALFASTQTQVAEVRASVTAVKAEVASGIVGREVGAEIRKRLYAASIRATAGDKARAASFRQSKVQAIRNAVQFNGPRTSWPNLPRASLAVVERHLEAIEHEAVFLGRSAVKAKQGTLPLN